MVRIKTMSTPRKQMIAKRLPLKLPFAYRDTPELRVLDLTPDGIRCVPVLGRTHLRAHRVVKIGRAHV